MYMQCPTCHTRSLFQPQALESNPICPRCGERFSLASAALRGHWRYQLTGFLEGQGQDGLIPVLLTILWLKRRGIGDRTTAATGRRLRFKDLNCEADVIALEAAMHRRSHPAVLL